jgi:hemin uptake protein HemP
MRIVIILFTKQTNDVSLDPMQPDSARTDMPTPPLVSSRFSTEPGQRSRQPDSIPTNLLFQGGQEILIDHNGEIYRLRITKNGKLILTK